MSNTTTPLASGSMRELLAITKATAEEHRLRILCLLEGRELCLCQIVAVLALATSTVSRHLSILQQARLVDSRKKGRWTYFSLATGDAPRAAHDTVALVSRTLRGDHQVRKDHEQLDQILKIDPEALCRQQCECK